MPVDDWDIVAEEAAEKLEIISEKMQLSPADRQYLRRLADAMRILKGMQ